MTGLLPPPAKLALRGLAASSALSEPLLPKKQPDCATQATVGTGNDDDGHSKNDSGGSAFSTAAVCVLAAGGFAASVFAMVSAPVVMVFVAGGICCINAPLMLHRHRQISSATDLRRSVANLNKQSEVLKKSIDFLILSIDKLENEVDDLNLIEHDLRQIVDQQGVNVNEFAELVSENEKILDAMKYNLRQNFVMQLAKIIMRSDTDGDMTIDQKEVPLLALRLQIELEPMGVDLDTDMFCTMVSEDNDIGSILRFCGEVLYAEYQPNESFEDASYASSYEASEDEDDDSFFSEIQAPGSKPASFAEFCRHLSSLNEEELRHEAGNVKMTTEDKMRMFTVQEKYSKGSVEVSRGSRMSVFPGSQVRKKRYSRMSAIANEANNRAKLSRKTAMRIENKRTESTGKKNIRRDSDEAVEV